MPDTETKSLPQVEELLRQAKAVHADLTATDQVRRDGIGALAIVIDQQRETIRTMTQEAEVAHERHVEEMAAMESRVEAAEASKAEAIRLTETAVHRATEAERRMLEMTRVFDNLVTTVNDRNRSLLEEDRSIEAIIARSGVDVTANKTVDVPVVPQEADRFVTRAADRGPVRIPGSPMPLVPVSPAPVAVAPQPIFAPIAEVSPAPVDPESVAKALTLIKGSEAEDVFAEPVPTEMLSPDERREEERSFGRLMTTFAGLLRPRSPVAPIVQTQQA